MNPPPPGRMVSAIVVTHGGLAEEFIATAKGILGAVDGVHAVSNEDKSPQALAAALGAMVEAGGPDARYLVLVDFLGGSGGHAALAVQRSHPNVRVVCGVNLPMILAFLNKRDQVDFERLPSELASRGRDSITVVDVEKL